MLVIAPVTDWLVIGIVVYIYSYVHTCIQLQESPLSKLSFRMLPINFYTRDGWPRQTIICDWILENRPCTHIWPIAFYWPS